MENGKPTVLVVEDDLPVRKYLSEALLGNGYGVMEAGDGQEAINICDAIDGKRLDAIISDLRMPNLTGGELAKYNYENRFYPFIVCTAIVDAKVALELLKVGVQDYLAKPVREQDFLAVVANSINRRALKTYLEDDLNPYAGNIGSLTIPSSLAEISRAGRWVENKLKGALSASEFNIFFSYLHEFMLNAHEHGNLKITEDEKAQLIRNGLLLTEIKNREKECAAKIKIDLSVLYNEVAVCVTDDGFGFNYRNYIDMPEDVLIQRLEMPNGRGITMAKSYFDSVIYSKGGASVLLTKKFG